MSVATTGSPAADASIATRGNPSRCEGRQKTSIAAYSRSTSSRWPVEQGTRGPCPIEQLIGQRIPLLRVSRADQQQAERWAKSVDGIDELRDALLLDQSRHRADDDLAIGESELCPNG